jgi:hypothetical protein
MAITPEAIQQAYSNGRLHEVAPNAENIRVHAMRVIVGKVPLGVRRELNAAVKAGLLGRLPKDGLKPEIYFHPDHLHGARDRQKSEAEYAISNIAGVMGVDKSVKESELKVDSAIVKLYHEISKQGLGASIKADAYYDDKYNVSRIINCRVGWKGVQLDIVMDLALEYSTISKKWTGYWKTYEPYGKFGQGQSANPVYMRHGFEGEVYGTQEHAISELVKVYEKMIAKSDLPHIVHVLSS